MATSFVCEHTAEFSTVPYMKSLLEKEFELVVPVYPWLSREFGCKSRRIHGDREFHVLVLFPRRPKTSDDNRLYLTINGELELFKTVGDDRGIPVLAGCPKATDFWELAQCKEQVWIEIGHPDTHEYLVSMDSLQSGPDTCRLDDADVLMLASTSKQHTMDSFENFVRDARYSQPASFFGGRYKPVYFLMKNKRGQSARHEGVEDQRMRDPSEEFSVHDSHPSGGN